MEDIRKEIHELKKQMLYITEENIRLEKQYRDGMEANFTLIKNRGKLKNLIQDYIGVKNELS